MSAGNKGVGVSFGVLIPRTYGRGKEVFCGPAYSFFTSWRLMLCDIRDDVAKMCNDNRSIV